MVEIQKVCVCFKKQVLLIKNVTNLRICFQNSEYLMRKLWEFAFRGGWNDADGKSKHLCFSKFSKMSKNGVDGKCDKIWIFVLKNEYCWWKMWQNVESRYVNYVRWAVHYGILGILGISRNWREILEICWSKYILIRYLDRA